MKIYNGNFSLNALRDHSGISLDDVPNIAAWIDRVESRESWKEAAARLLAMMG